MRILSTFLTLFLVMDPIGNVPMFITCLKDVPEGRKNRIVARESLIALLVMLFFLFFGPQLMGLLHIGQESLHIAGGVVLLLISLGMIFPGAGHVSMSQEKEGVGEPFIVPLAVPLIAGPSTLATVMIFSSQPDDFWLLLVALAAAWVAATAILLLSSTFSRLLGPRGLLACERLMGMILTVVAVQMFLDGTKLFLGSAVGMKS